MYVPLREGDNNVVFPEQPRDLEPEGAAYTSWTAIRRRLDPEEGVEYQGGISKVLANDRGGGILENIRIAGEYLIEQIFDFLNIGTVLDADTHMGA
jgi:hypothetical protein